MLHWEDASVQVSYYLFMRDFWGLISLCCPYLILDNTFAPILELWRTKYKNVPIKYNKPINWLSMKVNWLVSVNSNNFSRTLHCDETILFFFVYLIGFVFCHIFPVGFTVFPARWAITKLLKSFRGLSRGGTGK